jgi:hypothetical protein
VPFEMLVGYQLEREASELGAVLTVRKKALI